MPPIHSECLSRRASGTKRETLQLNYLLQFKVRSITASLTFSSAFSSSKRTVDFGLSRGYSGAQEAKHRMAMQIANFAGGPGRRKRLSGGKLAALD